MQRNQISEAWSKVFAVGYDRFLWLAERYGLTNQRHQLLANAYGNTVEVGAGTGLNLAHYPTAVTKLLLTEPDSRMAKKLTEKARRLQPTATVAISPGQSLPCQDNTVDTVVMTMVLCSADDPDAVVKEITRILRPGGQLLYFEHVRASTPALARWQDRCTPLWHHFGRGCQPNRETGTTLAKSKLTVEHQFNDRVRFVPPIVQPLIVGRAIKPPATK